MVSVRPRISAIVTTLGDAKGIRRLLQSLNMQSMLPIEVIIVDQNKNRATVANIIDGHWAFRVQHLHAPTLRGASLGRNAGVSRSTGEVLVFPDDDCWYPVDFVRRAIETLEFNGVSFVCGRAADESGRTINGRFEETRQPVTRKNVWTTSIEWLQVIRREAFETVSGYDGSIGVGASTPWQSAEAQDLLLRLLTSGFNGVYDPAIIGHHDELPTVDPDIALRLKLRRYARGMGYVLRLHGYGAGELLPWMIRPLGGACLSLLALNFRRTALFAHIALGRLEGYCKWPVSSLEGRP